MSKDAFAKLQVRLFDLEQIIASAPPTNPKHFLRHAEKISHAEKYIKELSELIDKLSTIPNVNFKVVRENVFHSQMENSDFCTIIMDRTYCSLIGVAKFEKATSYLVWLAPFSNL